MTLLLAQIAWIALVPALPLLAAILTAILGARYLKKLSHWPVLAATAASLLISLMLLVEPSQNSLEGEQQAGAAKTVTLWNWVHVEEAQPTKGFDLVINVALRADGLTVVMLTMVTFISLLVTIFSVGYMHNDRGYWRFFSYLGLFIFSMTMLVSVNNFLLLFVFWEAVGMCSYLLIGFWYEKPAAAAAGKKAFLVNRVGDFGFMLLFTFSSIGLPGLNGFAGQFLVLIGTFQRSMGSPLIVVAVLAVLGVVLGAWYMLYLVQRLFFGRLQEPAQEENPGASHEVADLSWREFSALAPLAVFVFWIGLQPSFFLRPMKPTLNALVAPAAEARQAAENRTAGTVQLSADQFTGKTSGTFQRTSEGR